MDLVMSSLAGLGSFALYFLVSIVFLLVFKYVYIAVTPYDEWKLVKEEKNVAAGTALSGAIVGYCIPIASAAENSVALLDFALWGVIALIAQIVAFLIVRVAFLPKITQRIENNEVSAGLILAAVSIGVGILNAACMTY